MLFTLPPDVSATIPRQDVRVLDDASVASMVAPTFSTADRLEVSESHDRLLWLTCNGGLSVAADSIRGAWLSPREHGPNVFASFTLLFGGTDGGVSLLTTAANILWLRDFARSIRPLIPHGIDDRLT
jgi:uncharacterized membrane protein